MLKLMYITNRPEIAQIAEEAGVDWIFIDMEFIGKDVRQGGLDTVQNHHTVDDIKTVRSVLTKSKVLARVNPIHETLTDYPSSEEEIDRAVEAGADIVMLPYFKSVAEVEKFLKAIKSSSERYNREVQTCLLVETAEAALLLDEILELKGIDMVHIGLNDLHLALHKKFMFELLSDGIVDSLAAKIKNKGIQFGFGGLASLNGGAIPGSVILKEHYRLGSSMVILSRSFCDTGKHTDLEEIRDLFHKGISEIRRLEKEVENAAHYFSDNRKKMMQSVQNYIDDRR